MLIFVRDHFGDLIKGSIGSVFSIGAVVVSTLQEVEQWLRLASLCVGIAVGLITIWSILQKHRRDKEMRDDVIKHASEKLRNSIK